MPLTLHASANPYNWKASIEKYLVDTFQGVTTFPASVAAANWAWPPRKLDTAALDYWVRPTLHSVPSPFYRAASGGQPGYLRQMLLMIEVFCKRPHYDSATGGMGILEQAAALFMGGFTNRTGITVKDYSLAGANTLGKFWAVGREVVAVPQEDLWLRTRVDVNLEWSEEQDTAA